MVYVPKTDNIYAFGGLNFLTPWEMETLSEFSYISLERNDTWNYLKSSSRIVNSVFVASYPYIYAYGGCKNLATDVYVYCSNISSDLMKYDIIQGEWTVEDTHVPRTDARGALTANNVLYIYGGKNIENEYVGDLVYFSNS
jgi:hypothetical protein